MRIHLILFFGAICFMLAYSACAPYSSYETKENKTNSLMMPITSSLVHDQIEGTQSTKEGTDPVVKPDKPKHETTIDSNEKEYLLGAGDRLEVIFSFISKSTESEYKIRIRDKIHLQFVHNPTFDRTVMVRADGKVDLPFNGAIQAVGKTLKELKAAILATYKMKSSDLVDPEIDLYFEEFNTKEDELRTMLWTGINGNSREILIPPDGILNLPLVGNIKADGVRIEDLCKRIEQAYNRIGYSNIDLTLILKQAMSSEVYLMGEFVNKGAMQLQGPMTILQVIARAGGFTRDADYQNISLTRMRDSKVQQYSVNFDSWQKGNFSNIPIFIKPGDVIFVPKMSNKYAYIAGEVNAPGRIEINLDSTISARQAVAMAGGITDRGTQKQLLILRVNGQQNPEVIQVNPQPQIYNDFSSASVQEAAEGEAMGLFPNQNSFRTSMRDRPLNTNRHVSFDDVILKPGDIVYVPSSLVGDFQRFAKQWFRDGIWAVLPFNASATYTYQKTSIDD